MPADSILITLADMERLSRLVRALRHSLFRDQQQLELLDQTLAAAEVRPPEELPQDLVRMNSCVRVFDFDTRSRGLYTLAFPEEADILRGMISVLAPLGIALLGRRKGDVVVAHVPGGTRKLRIDGVRQQSVVSRTERSKDSPTKSGARLRANDEPALAEGGS